MRHQLKNPRFYVMILSDAAIFAGSFVMAYVLRFDFRLTPSDLHGIGLVLPFLIPAKLVVFFLFGLYRGMWRYAGVEDFWKLAQASLLSSALVVTFVLYAYRFQGFPRSVFLIDCGLAFLITGGLRMVIRSYYNAMNSPHGLRAFSLPSLRGRDDGARRSRRRKTRISRPATFLRPDPRAERAPAVAASVAFRLPPLCLAEQALPE